MTLLHAGLLTPLDYLYDFDEGTINEEELKNNID